MSHFSVLVVAENQAELEKKLLPYHEYECTGIKEHTEWVDREEEFREEYATKKVECVVKNDKVIGAKFDRDNETVKTMWHEDEPGNILSTKTFILSDGYDLVETNINKLYSTFDEFMKEWHSYNEGNKHPETGRYGHLTNPKAQWDWWVVGGRWSGFLTLKDGENASTALNGEIDWVKMHDEKQEKQEEYFNKWWKAYNSYSGTPSEQQIKQYDDWCIRNEKVAEVFKNVWEFAKADYAFDEIEDSFWSLGEAEELLTKSIEEYMIVKPLTFAFVGEDGSWNQRAEMGWWGASDDEKATNCYEGEWWQLVQTLPADKRIYVVDCHI